jgi:hypothetical protein
VLHSLNNGQVDCQLTSSHVVVVSFKTEQAAIQVEGGGGLEAVKLKLAGEYIQ